MSSKGNLFNSFVHLIRDLHDDALATEISKPDRLLIETACIGSKRIDIAYAPFDHVNHNADIVIVRSEEHTSELQSLMRISYAVFCLKKQINKTNDKHIQCNETIN